MTGSLRARKVARFAKGAIRDLCKSRSSVEIHLCAVYDLNLAYKVESVRFYAANSCIIVKAVDFSDEIKLAV